MQSFYRTRSTSRLSPAFDPLPSTSGCKSKPTRVKAESMFSPLAQEFDAPAASSSRVDRGPQKKALLIGINGLSSPVEDYRPLHGPHQDVYQMKTLLIESYGYQEENIQVLVDDGIPENMQPDRKNIMSSIDTLVNGAQKGDKLFFQYCGHTIQVPNRHNTEEDGLDECIVPLDGEDRMITDNELRARLVDTLPAGSSLIAVFDSCHSASLLDLEHVRCNRVFVPWLSKGKRRSDELRNGIVRRLALPAESPCTAYQLSPTCMRGQRSPIDTLHSPVHSHWQSPRSPLSPRGYRAAPWNIPFDGSTSDTAVAESGQLPYVSPASRAALRRPPPLKLWDSKLSNNKENNPVSAVCSPSSKPWFTSDTLALSTEGTLYESPLSQYCQGWCRRPNEDTSLFCTKVPDGELADVISLGSCKDSELSWENEEGMSMTRALVQVLTENPHPTLRELVTSISHTLHGLALKRHLQTKAWNRYRKANAIESPGSGSFDTETFQHPQIASRKPLDMEGKWDP
ncbi:caspase domain-containing protein [Mycena crocata]|nr:caspase domain-containing protein [Mycena crocata]